MRFCSANEANGWSSDYSDSTLMHTESFSLSKLSLALTLFPICHWRLETKTVSFLGALDPSLHVVVSFNAKH